MAICEMKPSSDSVESLVTNRLYDAKPDVRIKTLQLLCATKTGTNATLPILRQILQSADGKEQVIATRCLADLEKAAEPALPEVVALIKNDKNDPSAIFTACRILRLVDNIDLSVVPALRARLAKLGESTSGFETAVTLARIDAGQSEGLDLLLKVAADRNSSLRSQAINHLGMVGRNAKRAGPVLYEIAMSDTPFTWSSAAWALVNIGETNLAMKVGYHRLGSQYNDYQVTGARLLIACDSTNDAAITRLLELAWDMGPSVGVFSPSGHSVGAIMQLGRLRPMTSRVLSNLEAISTKQNHPGREEAQKALRILKKEEGQTKSPGK
jgi:hypothetical protein